MKNRDFNYKKFKEERTPNIRCSHLECREELVYLMETTDIAACPKCATIYDLKIYRKEIKKWK